MDLEEVAEDLSIKLPAQLAAAVVLPGQEEPRSFQESVVPRLFLRVITWRVKLVVAELLLLQVEGEPRFCLGPLW